MNTGNEGFAEAIGLSKEWPAVILDENLMDCSGLLAWATSYFEAAELLAGRPRKIDSLGFYSGPVMQVAGLATELALKCLLRGDGLSESETRKFGHNTYGAYLAAREAFDEVKFVKLVLSNTEHLLLPAGVRERLEAAGEPDPWSRWRVYFDHLRILDSVYDRPYRNRYPTPGSIILPEVDIILIGTKILLHAMEDRLGSLQPHIGVD